jgi:hypothetical protein
MVLTGLAYSQGRDGSGHLLSGKVPARARGDNASSFPRLVFVSESEAREVIRLLLDSHYPRHRWDGQKRTYLDTFRQQRAS